MCNFYNCMTADKNTLYSIYKHRKAYYTKKHVKYPTCSHMRGHQFKIVNKTKKTKFPSLSSSLPPTVSLFFQYTKQLERKEKLHLDKKRT
jgi:hypothetical protein